MDRLHAMALFVRTVEAGSFSAAARDLNLGQPAVSKAIAGLEQRLGVRLLNRTTRRLAPTEAGQAFYERARRALDEAEEAEVAARGAGTGFEGRLRVCSPVTFGRMLIAPRLERLLSAHPALLLEFVMDDRVIDLVEANIDVAVRLGRLRDSSLTAHKIATAQRQVVASPAYLARAGVPVAPLDLQTHDAVLYTQELRTEWRFRKDGHEVAVSMRPRISFTAAEGVREGVLAGLGFAVVSSWMVAPELASGAAQSVLTDWELPSVDAWAVFPAGRLPAAKACAFADWLRDELATDPAAPACGSA